MGCLDPRGAKVSVHHVALAATAVRRTLQAQFWQAQQTSSESGRAVAPVIASLLVPCQALAAASPSFSDAASHIESIYATLSALWELQLADGTQAYTQPRMYHLIRNVGASLQDLCRRSLRGDAERPWQRGAAELRAAIGDALALLHDWRSARIGQLMRDWTPGPAAISKHAWAGPAFEDAAMCAFVSHLEDALAIEDLDAELRTQLGAEHSDAIAAAFAAVRDADFTLVRAHNPSTSPHRCSSTI